MIRKIIVAGALSWVIAGLKISIDLALVAAFIREIVSSEVGLGHNISGAGALYDIPRVLFGVLTISVVASCLPAIVWRGERWRPNLFTK